MSPYEAFTRERPKEDAFEAVRAAEFPTRPTRLGSIFLFPDRRTADVANADWFSGLRVILKATATEVLAVGTFDSRHLDVREQAWGEAARLYWSGVHTRDPRLEVVLCGVVQLSGWEPYGRMLSFDASSS